MYDYRYGRPALSILWVVRNMYRHPLHFWQMQEVQLSRGPGRLWQYGLLLLLPMVMVGLYMLFDPQSSPPLRSASVVHAIDGAVRDAAAACMYLCGFCLVHEVLCRISLLSGCARDTHPAKDVVGYGLVWFAPVMVGTLFACRYGRALFSTDVQIRYVLIALAAGCLTVGSCAAWAVTLYKGGKFVSGGGRVVAVWCVLTNPFWYLLIWLVMTSG